jgi:ribosome recycling factor
MEELQEKFKENIQKQLKDYQDNMNKKLEKTQKEINELRGLQQTPN